MWLKPVETHWHLLTLASTRVWVWEWEKTRKLAKIGQKGPNGYLTQNDVE